MRVIGLCIEGSKCSLSRKQLGCEEIKVCHLFGWHEMDCKLWGEIYKELEDEIWPTN